MCVCWAGCVKRTVSLREHGLHVPTTLAAVDAERGHLLLAGHADDGVCDCAVIDLHNYQVLRLFSAPAGEAPVKFVAVAHDSREAPGRARLFASRTDSTLLAFSYDC